MHRLKGRSLICTSIALVIERGGEPQVADGPRGYMGSTSHCVSPASLHLSPPHPGTSAECRGLRPPAALPSCILRPRAPAPRLLTGSAPALSHAEKPIGRGARGSNNKSGFSGAQGYRNAKLLPRQLVGSRGGPHRPAGGCRRTARGRDPRYRRAGPPGHGPNKEAAPAFRSPTRRRVPRRGQVSVGQTQGGSATRPGPARPGAPPNPRATRYP